MALRPSKGGAFGHVERLGLELVAAGHEVAVAGPHGAHRSSLGLEVEYIEMGRAIEPVADARAIRELAGVVRRWKPDLVHAHGSKGGVVARLARVGAPRVPLVFTPHNYAFTNWFAGKGERRAYRLIERSLGPLTSRTLCVCNAEASAAATVTSRRRIRVVHNGIEPLTPTEPLPELRAFRGDGPLVGALTDFSPPKGVSTLLEAMPAVRRAVPGARLALAGDGPMRAEVEQAVARLGLSDDVLLLGQIPRPEPFLAGLDVLAAPGWSESFPYAILEAMSLEKPIVATRVGGVGEAIVDHVSGRLVDARDPQALAVAITDLLSDRESAEAMGRAAGQRLRERFTLQRMVAGTLSVYAELGLK